MKKVVTILAVVFCTIAFTSCSDSSEDLEERIILENELEIYSVDKRDIIRPGDQHGNK